MISEYLDKYGLVSPEPVVPGTRGSDNGVLFTAEYMILQHLLGNNLEQGYSYSMLSCVDTHGYLHRAPDDPSEDAPDDHYGYLAAAALTGKLSPLKLSLKCLHPALIYLNLMVKGSPLRYLLSPLIALIIAFSNLNEDITNTSNKILTWCLIQGTRKSLLCQLAGKFWLYRMSRIYSGGISAAFYIYFGIKHPISQDILKLYK